MECKGLHVYRLEQQELERRFAEKWDVLNTRQNTEAPLERLLFGGGKPVSERDNQVAATVVQWLGSLEGQKFLQEVMGGGSHV